MATAVDIPNNEESAASEIDDSNPFDRDPSMEMVFGSGGRTITIREPLYGEKEGLTAQTKGIGTPETGGPAGDLN